MKKWEEGMRSTNSVVFVSPLPSTRLAVDRVGLISLLLPLVLFPFSSSLTSTSFSLIYSLISFLPLLPTVPSSGTVLSRLGWGRLA